MTDNLSLLFAALLYERVKPVLDRRTSFAGPLMRILMRYMRVHCEPDLVKRLPYFRCLEGKQGESGSVINLKST